MISGSTLRDAIVSGYHHISNNSKAVNELNVFPVPDGDTGTNMTLTMGNAARELKMLTEPTCTQVADTTSAALLRGARGNSGVILSLLFRGFAKGLKDIENAGGKHLADALTYGVEAAYKAVMKPTEGTILTVARMAAEAARRRSGESGDAVQVWQAAMTAAEKTLSETPEMLPVLKKAGVVDAGGKGFLIIMQGMMSVFRDNEIILPGEKEAEVSAASAAARLEEEITFTYCTEFIVQWNGENEGAPLLLRAYLETIGDSVVVVDDSDIIKVHIHTDQPNLALREGLGLGPLINIKIDNMRDQHERARHEAKEPGDDTSPAEPAGNGPAPMTDPYGFVAVVAGEGLHTIFRDLGVSQIVNGGQTMNPSTEDILRAIEKTPARTVFVLPNNKNIIMAAEQTVALSTREVIVLQTRSIPMGISAMLAFDETASPKENAAAMTTAADKVGTGQITFAARDSEYDGHKIKAGEILAMKNGRVSFIEQDITKAVVKLCKSLTKKDSQFITLMYGEGVDEFTAERVAETVRTKISQPVEVTVVNGGQPVYHYLISVE